MSHDPTSARRVPVHRRSIDIEAFDAPDHFELVCPRPGPAVVQATREQH
jgi:hypothetical protein